MIGITLTSEQIRTAPPDVRRWIEREVMASLGQQSQPADEPRGEHLAVCSAAQAEAVLAQIQGVLPVVNVFFELGRQGAIFGQPNVEAFRLLDIAHHTRLADVTQVVACLDIINQAFSNACGDATAQFCALDREGHCFIALETQQNILAALAESDRQAAACARRGPRFCPAARCYFQRSAGSGARCSRISPARMRQPDCEVSGVSEGSRICLAARGEHSDRRFGERYRACECRRPN